MFRIRLHDIAAQKLRQGWSAVRKKPSTGVAPRNAALRAEDIRAWLRRLERAEQSGQVRSAQRGRIDLIFDVLTATANGSVQDPARAAAALLEGMDRNTLLQGGRRRDTPAGGARTAAGATQREPDRGMQRHTRRSAIALPEHGLIYFSTPKVASSTIKATLWRLGLGDPEAVPPEPIHEARDGSPLQWPPDLTYDDLLKWINQPQYRRFCFVRNPYSRLLSCYLHKIKNRGNRPSLEVLELRRSALGKSGIEEMAFGEFVEAVGRQAPMKMNPHWRVQTAHLLWERISYDFVGRIEHFRSDLERLGSVLGTDLQPYLHVKSRHQTGAADVIAEYYTSDLREQVYRIYQSDFQAFDYSPELPIGKRDPAEPSGIVRA